MSSYTPEEIKLINSTTTEFYKTVSESFSSTRQHEWEGWNKCLQYIKEGDKVLDLGCGNRRFSKFLEVNNKMTEMTVTDSQCQASPDTDCQSLSSQSSLSSRCHVDSYDNFAWDDKVKEVDIIESLLNDNLNLKPYDVAVCFGVMHHIPTAELREKLLKELTKSKIAIVSFWQFEKDERIFNKAKKTTLLAKEKFGLQNLEEGDYFLGWQDREDVFRFCHNFTDEEIKNLSQNYHVVDQYLADNLNSYLVVSNV